MPSSRFDKTLDTARGAKVFSKLKAGIARSASPDAEQHEDQDTKGLEETLKRKRREFRRFRKEAKQEGLGGREHKKRKKTLQQEIFRLENELRAAEEGRAGDGAVTGALPDFLVIGGKKCGTSYFYHLLTQHPLVEPASAKELHYFDAHLESGIEWYRQCFPAPKLKNGRRTITGEATPYMNGRHAPQRVAEVVPEARLIALLRDPVDRAYSDYQHEVRHGKEHRSFEEAVTLKGLADRSKYLTRSIYVDQLLRWYEFFPEERLLVLKSEDFFGNPAGTLETSFGFLGLPEWKPEALLKSRASVGRNRRDKRNKGGYEGGMDPGLRERLQGYFEPHNRRLYELIGADLGW